jgi:Tol biopolymer transport system component
MGNLVRASALTGALALMAASLGGCHGDVEPFSANDRDPNDEFITLRLTFSPGDDQTPTWSQDGDSVYYAATGFDVFSDESVVLVGVPRLGGAAGMITSNVQVPGTAERWLVAPQVHPSGERFAYAEVGPPWPAVCPSIEPSCSPAIDNTALPRLRDVIVRVRRFDATGSVDSDPLVTVPIPGVVYDFNIQNTPRVHVVRNFPFHQLFDEERVSVFRPSWAPTGDRLVFSDGLTLLVWNTSDAPLVLPNTDEGVSPAWSPDGEWIAFSRLERADSSASTCTYISDPPPVPPTPTCVQQRTDYDPGRRLLTLVRPDGTDVTQLGEGEDPAWSPDGSALYFRRADQIWRSAPDGSGATPIDFTNGGREPAVSPDGQYLAISVLGERGDYDIWVISLERLP